MLILCKRILPVLSLLVFLSCSDPLYENEDDPPKGANYDEFIKRGYGKESFASTAQLTWFHLPDSGAPTARYGHSLIVYEDGILIWGGIAIGDKETAAERIASTGQSSGGMYQFSTNSWLPMTTQNAPRTLNGHASGWTGKRMLIWGGSVSGDQGGLFDPKTNTWYKIAQNDQPEALSDLKWLWEGGVLFILGGIFVDSGKSNSKVYSYDSEFNKWTVLAEQTPISLESARIYFEDDKIYVCKFADDITKQQIASFDTNELAWLPVKSVSSITNEEVLFQIASQDIDGNVFAIGYETTPSSYAIYQLDLTEAVWRKLEVELSDKKYSGIFSLWPIAQDRIMLWQTQPLFASLPYETFLIDLATQRVLQLAAEALPELRYETAYKVDSQKLYLWGGRKPATSNSYLNSGAVINLSF